MSIETAVRQARTRQRVAVACLAAAVVWPVGRVDDGPVLCPVRRFTGVPCPGCGLTRTFVHALHGDVAAAFRAHAFGLLVVGLFVGWAVTGARHQGTVLDPQTWTTGRRRTVLALVASGWIAYAATRVSS